MQIGAYSDSISSNGTSLEFSLTASNFPLLILLQRRMILQEWIDFKVPDGIKRFHIASALARHHAFSTYDHGKMALLWKLLRSEITAYSRRAAILGLVLDKKHCNDLMYTAPNALHAIWYRQFPGTVTACLSQLSILRIFLYDIMPSMVSLRCGLYSAIDAWWDSNAAAT